MDFPASKPSRSSTTYASGRTIKLAPLGCPYCHCELRAQDVEPLDGGDARVVCAGCHRNLLKIEKQ